MIYVGIGRDLINFVVSCVGFFGLNFFVVNFLIKRFDFLILGRKGNYLDEEVEEIIDKKVNLNNDILIEIIIDFLGGDFNIVEVDVCMIRLCVFVKDNVLVKEELMWKKVGVIGLIVKGNGI